MRGAYESVPVSELEIDCLSAVGEPAEEALNEYIEGVDAWGECLATAGCGTSTVEPELQRRWRLASDSLATAHAGARRLARG